MSAEPGKAHAGGSGLVWDDPVIDGIGIVFLGGWEKGSLPATSYKFILIPSQ